MNSITKTKKNFLSGLTRFFDIKTRLRNWLFSDNELQYMIQDEVYSQTSDNMSKVDDWVYEVESLEDKVNDFEYKIEEFEDYTLDNIEREASNQVRELMDEVRNDYVVELTLTKKENANGE